MRAHKNIVASVAWCTRFAIVELEPVDIACLQNIVIVEYDGSFPRQ